MPLLNYTTTVAADRTIAQVQKMLATAGARRVMTEYDVDGHAVGVAFTARTGHGDRSFMLPVDANAVLNVLRADGVPARFATTEHAYRVAWRIVKDWLAAQLAIIATEMVTLDQVMLPYMAGPDGRTMWERYEEGQLALPSGPSDG